LSASSENKSGFPEIFYVKMSQDFRSQVLSVGAEASLAADDYLPHSSQAEEVD
jgi:hypothetical protein